MNKKASNTPPPEIEHPDAPPRPTGTQMTKDGMAVVFDEWAKRYAEDPKSFFDILDDEGKPVTGYGESCAQYFNDLYNEVIVKAA